MTIEELEAALANLEWKGSDFCRKTGVSRATISRWVRGITEIPLWVPAYLSAMQAIADLYRNTVMPGSGWGTEDDENAANDEKA